MADAAAAAEVEGEGGEMEGEGLDVEGMLDLDLVTPAQFQQFLDIYDHVCFDCDGVLWRGAVSLPGAREVVAALEARGKSVSFISNNSCSSPEEDRLQFERIGVPDGYDRLTNPSKAIARYLRSIRYDDPLYCVASPNTVRVLRESGFHCLTGPAEGSDDVHALAQYCDVPRVGGRAVRCVVMDSDFKVNMCKLTAAASVLREPWALLVAGAPDTRVALPGGRVALGTGMFTGVLEQECGVRAVTLAKPSPDLAALLAPDDLVPPARTLFVGDSLVTDVMFAHVRGQRVLLLLSGVTTGAQLLAQYGPLRPPPRGAPLPAPFAAPAAPPAFGRLLPPHYVASSLQKLAEHFAALPE